MPRLLQIDSCRGILSTGRITESIGRLASECGWDCHIAHGARYVGRSQMSSYQIGSVMDEYIHFAGSLFLDRHGLGSSFATKRLLNKIENDIKPDLIHLHCIHGYYLNYKLLFEYLSQKKIPVVWTFHDCWAFTGHCAHFENVRCTKWKTNCAECPNLQQYPRSITDASERNYKLKHRLFTSLHDLTVVPVSEWMTELVSASFMNKAKVKTICNGVDISLFNLCSEDVRTDLKNELGVGQRKMILGVAGTWTDQKGLADFHALSEMITDDYIIVLVGLDSKQMKSLPANIIGVERVSAPEKLAKLYAAADVFVNPTYADTFPTVNIEALACGTPVVTYDTGGSPEVLSEFTGKVVSVGNKEALLHAVIEVTSTDRDVNRRACRERAVSRYDMNARFMDYVDLYEELIDNYKIK